MVLVSLNRSGIIQYKVGTEVRPKCFTLINIQLINVLGHRSSKCSPASNKNTTTGHSIFLKFTNKKVSSGQNRVDSQLDFFVSLFMFLCLWWVRVLCVCGVWGGEMSYAKLCIA